MASTAIPNLKTTIIAALEAADGLRDVVVTADSEPLRADEYVWLYKARSKRQFGALGPRPAPIDEELRVYLRILVLKGSDKSAPSEERALELADVVESALRDLEPGRPFLSPLLIEELDDEPLQFDQKRGCHVLMTVATKARI